MLPRPNHLIPSPFTHPRALCSSGASLHPARLTQWRGRGGGCAESVPALPSTYRERGSISRIYLSGGRHLAATRWGEAPMILAYSISWEAVGGREGDHYTAGGRESFARRIRQSPHATHNTPTHTRTLL